MANYIARTHPRSRKLASLVVQRGFVGEPGGSISHPSLTVPIVMTRVRLTIRAQLSSSVLL